MKSQLMREIPSLKILEMKITSMTNPKKVLNIPKNLKEVSFNLAILVNRSDIVLSEFFVKIITDVIQDESENK